MFLAALFNSLALAGFGQTAPAQPEQSNPEARTLELEKLMVTGSNIRMTAADADKGAVPLEMISAQRFQLSSSESVADYLRSVPAVTGFMNTAGNTEFTTRSQTLNLRGFGGNYTLVLVNGRRFAGEGANADVSVIPADAIESIEILKSGSSAIYGTDAVAGVVNIKLKHNYQGASFTASYGNTTNKDAGVQRYALSFGQTHDKLRVSGTAEWQRHNAIYRFDRSITASRNWVALGGADRRNGTYTTVQRILGLSSAPAGLIIDVSKIGVGQTSLNPASYVAVLPDQKLTTSEPEAWPAFSTFSTSWGLNYEILGKRLEIFAEGFYSDKKTRFEFQPPTARVSVAANNPFNPFGQAVTVVYSFGPNERDLSRPALDINYLTALNNTFGARGDIGSFTYEVAYTRYQHQIRQREQDDLDQTKAQAAVNAGTFNPFGYWANPPTLIGTLYMTPRELMAKDTLDLMSAKLSGTVVELPAGPLRFAAGAEHRTAGSEVRYDDGWRTTNTLWHPPSAGFVNNRNSRSVDAYFAELRAPLWLSKSSDSVVSGFEVSVAGRKETYSADKSVTVPQGSARLSLWDDAVILRASYSESFRAPTLANLNTPVTTTLNSVANILDPVRGGLFPFFVTGGGNPNLKPESGTNYNFGVIYSPKAKQALTLKVDYWNVTINDVIVSPNAVDVMNGTSPVGSVTRDANLVPTLDLRIANSGEFTASGFDVGVVYRLNKGSLGTFTFDLNGTYNTELEATFGTTVTDYLARLSNTYGSMPKIRAVFGTDWRRDKWNAAMFLHHMSGATEPAGTGRRKIEGYTTGDLQVTYAFKDSARWRGALRNSSLTLGVENVWDEALPFVDTTVEGWDRSLADYRGRYIYVQFRKKL